jgi:hypothetical protein
MKYLAVCALVLLAACSGDPTSPPEPLAVVPLIEPVRPSTEVIPFGTCVPGRWICND